MSYDLVVIGTGAAGEAAAYAGAERGGKVAVVENSLVGGLCSFWACMPTKTLLDSARKRWEGAEYPWERASARRDWMINREGIDFPDDSGHVHGLEGAGVEILRGTARITGAGRLEVDMKEGSPRSLETRNVVIAAGSTPFIPPVEGLADAGYWTSNDASSARELPSSLVVLGGGPVGVELAQVYSRFGVKVTLVEGSRLLAREHPKTAEIVSAQLEREGIDIRLGGHAVKVERGGAGRIVSLDDGTTVEGAELLVSVGRRAADLRAMGALEAGGKLTDRGTADHDEHLSIGDGLFVAGDAAGGLQFTHVADYEGRIAAAGAFGEDAHADLTWVPKTTFTEPETGAVGWTVEEAQQQGIDAFEVTQDFSTTARGYSIEPPWPSPNGKAIREGSPGHVTAVVDRERKVLVGAFAACPGASELIHEGVIAIKAAVPVSVLADAIHGFPTAARAFGNLMLDAEKQLR
ncbi:MAG TPA: NAD(P)/FAD-dependent oxidoreductase [Actinomycetota bacterium]|nr:NAD(P)/FAD-dependent oxidoreductase [Actinomycetota bacterium]